MSTRDVTIRDVVREEVLPVRHVRVEPFSVTIHHRGLSVREMAQIQDAVVEAAHRIRRMRGGADGSPFAWEGQQ